MPQAALARPPARPPVRPPEPALGLKAPERATPHHTKPLLEPCARLGHRRGPSPPAPALGQVHFVPCDSSATAADGTDSGLPDALDVEEAVLDEPCAGRDDGSEAAAAQRGQCAWQPGGGACLALAGRTHVVLKHRPAAAEERGAWREEPLVGGDGALHLAPVCAVAWAPGAALLASADLDGAVLLWAVDDRAPLARWACAGPACGLAWLPAAGQVPHQVLAMSNAEGQVAVWAAQRKPPAAASPERPKAPAAAAAAAASSDDESPLKLKKASKGAKAARKAASRANGATEAEAPAPATPAAAPAVPAAVSLAAASDDEGFDFDTDDELTKAGGEEAEEGGGTVETPAAKAPVAEVTPIEEAAAEEAPAAAKKTTAQRLKEALKEATVTEASESKSEKRVRGLVQ